MANFEIVYAKLALSFEFKEKCTEVYFSDYGQISFLFQRNLMPKIAVLSDIHFGYKSSNTSLHPECCMLDGTEDNGRDNVDKLVNALHDVSEVILLGDIWDFQLSSYAQAIRASLYFFEQLSMLDLGAITYIPGNHDHAMWHYDVIHKRLIKELGGATLRTPSDDFKFSSPIFLAQNPDDEGSFLSGLLNHGKEVNRKTLINYPWLAREIGGKKYLFLHGHFLEREQKFGKNLVVSSILQSNQKDVPLTLDELELFSTPQYFLFTSVAQSQVGRDALHSRYDALSSAFQVNDVDKFDNDLQVHIRRYAGQWLYEANLILSVVDYVVYGHTHSAGVSNIRWKGAEKAIKFNTGTWLHHKHSADGTIGTYLKIDDSAQGHPTLYTLRSTGDSPVQHAHMEELNAGKRPHICPTMVSTTSRSMGIAVRFITRIFNEGSHEP